MEGRVKWVLWTGSVSVVLWCGLACLSRSDAPMPVGVLLTILGALWVACLLAWRFGELPNDRRWVRLVLGLALLMRLPGLWAEPSYEDDYQRFLWDGWNFLEYGTPYRGAPEDFFDDPAVPDAMLEVLDEVNYAEVPTIYPPVCQAVFGLAAWISPGSLLSLRVVLMGFEMLALVVFSRIVSDRSLLLMAWCPLLIFETNFQVHPDVLGMLALLIAFASRKRGNELMVGIFAGLALGVKVTALPALPFLMWPLRWRSMAGLIGVIALMYLPFLAQGSRADLDGLVVFGREWEYNASLYSVGTHWFEGGAVKWAMVGVFLTFFGVMWGRWVVMKGRLEALPSRIVLGFAFLLLVSPVVNPWYLIWAVPFVCLAPRAWSIGALALISLSYVRGQTLPGSNLGNFEQPSLVQGLEYVLIVLLATCGVWMRRVGVWLSSSITLDK